MTPEPARALPTLPGTSREPTVANRDEFRARVLAHLRVQGFQVANDRLIAPVTRDKDKLRSLHAEAVAAQRAKSANTLRRYEDAFVRSLADGSDLFPAAIEPVLVQINDRRSFSGLLWRWCSLHWSIPVSSGYGRRLRFLVVDRGNGGKVMGLIGLADPVFALGVRDAWIGWDLDTRRERLANVMDAFVLGAVPPYNALRVGKLVALLATSAEVRNAFYDQYGHKQTLIAQRDPNARLALVTTTSALGRSSVYNRLTGPDGALAFQSVGYTIGSGDFHLSGAIYDALAKFAAENNPEGRTHAHKRWRSGGPRNRREVIQRALQALDLDPRQLRLHGIRREVFVAPLMSNARDYLLDGAEPMWTASSVDELAEHWSHRWALPRAARDDGWREFCPESWRFYTRSTRLGLLSKLGFVIPRLYRLRVLVNDPLADSPQLPAEVLQTMLEQIPAITEEASRILGPMRDQAKSLRSLLIERDWIEEIDISLAGQAAVAAVDGAQIQEQLYAGDLLVAVAVAAEGLTPIGRLGEAPAHKAWSRFINHDSDNDRLGKAAMVAQELALLRGLPHDMCILDGSHQTPVIVMNSVLASQSREVRLQAVEVLRDNDAVAALAALCDPATGAKIVACPKADSSRDLGELLTERLAEVESFNLPATDKVLASLVLEPGEMFKAFQVPKQWAKLHIQERDDVDEKQEPGLKPLARGLNKAIQPLRDQKIRITYAKPPACNTAVKIEFKEWKGPDWRRQAGAMIAAETPAPHLQEPFAQHLADQWAKSIGVGVQAQLQGVRLDLTESRNPTFLEYLVRSYRTFGG